MAIAKPTAVVVDDDALARERVKGLLREAPLVEVVGEAADGLSALRLIEELRPDVVFLDIEMPELSGLQVLERLRHRPAVIFTTAYARHAVAAFELAAVDYLLKPFGLDRFREAVERAVRSRPGPQAASSPPVERAREAVPEGEALRRLFLREREAILPVEVSRITRFEADGDYVVVHAGERPHLVRLRLQDLEARLDDRFLRVHRSHLVNLDHVRRFEPHDATRLAVVMTDGTRIVASRARSQELRRLAR
jgi:two-component system, LytTR family, response regulator